MNKSGSEIIVQCLLQQGVDTVFGYPGGAIMPLYDALYDAPLKHILTVHEQGAAHAADGYARASGKTGVCIATSGPGATNLITGLATAYMDSSPVVAITGQVPTTLLGRDSFQEIDITGMTMPVTKRNFLVRDPDSLAGTIRQAFAVAANGRPGPVLIDVPKDILLAPAATEARTEPGPAAPALYRPDEHAIQEAVSRLLSAKRPVLLVGGGAASAGARQAIFDFLARYPLPVVSTLMGLGALPSDYPLFLGLTGMHGHKAANYSIAEADLIVAAGTRFSDRITSRPDVYAADKTVIHLDIDPAEFNKNVRSQIQISGDLACSLQAIAAGLTSGQSTKRTDWLKKAAAWQQSHRYAYQPERLTAPWIMKHMSEQLSGQPTIWVTDVGQHQMWAAQHLRLAEPKCWLTSGGMGAMGFGLPAALGAQAACPAKRVVLIAGDGGFKMTGTELHTAVTHNLPVICVIINNRALGMVRQWQQLFFRQRYSSTLLPDFDFAAFAGACGAPAAAVSTPVEFTAAFAQALAASSPAVIVANIERELLVEPMVSPGSPVNQFIDMEAL